MRQLPAYPNEKDGVVEKEAKDGAALEAAEKGVPNPPTLGIEAP